MNLMHVDLEGHGIPKDAEILVFLIAEDLKGRKLINAVTNIGCDGSFCLPDLCNLVLSLTGFDDCPDDLYIFYFDLLDLYCEKVTHENSPPIKEAFCIYKGLIAERQRRLDKSTCL